MASKANPASTSVAAKPKKAASPLKKKATPAKSNSAATEFILSAPEAQEVFVVGDFDGWDSQKNKMRRFKDGIWKKSLKLKPGRYEYRFKVDGEWWCDPACPDRQCNPYGSENSVINVKA